MTPTKPPAPVIELDAHRAFVETEWTARWEREFRARYWVERRGLFYPRGTPPALMEPRPSPRRRMLGP